MPTRKSTGHKGRRRSVSATEAQNNFGRVLDHAALEGVVYITKYDRPTAVVLSIDKYNEVAAAKDVNLDGLTREFDKRLARMQAAGTAAGFDDLFAMDATQLAAAATRAARTRPRRRGARRAARGTGSKASRVGAQREKK